MVGPRMLVLMMVPTLLALFVLSTKWGRPLGDQWRRPSRLWLLVIGVVVAVAPQPAILADRLDEHLVNRIDAIVILAVLAVVALSNRGLFRPNAMGLGFCTFLVGGALNAIAKALFGGMPILGSAAATAGYDLVPGKPPAAGYVFSDGGGPPMVLLGDFIPIPGFFKVLSIGDLALFVGLATLAAIAIAHAWSTAGQLESPAGPRDRTRHAGSSMARQTHN